MLLLNDSYQKKFIDYKQQLLESEGGGTKLGFSK